MNENPIEKNPITKGVLQPTANGLWVEEHTGNEFVINHYGKITPLTKPSTETEETLLMEDDQIIEEVIPTDTYKQYRTEVNEALEGGDRNCYTHSKFEINDNMCHHTLMEVDDNNHKTVLKAGVFPYNSSFKNHMLEPSAIDYAKRSPIVTLQVLGEKSSATCCAISENNNLLSIVNINRDYAIEIYETINQTPPLIFLEQQNNLLTEINKATERSGPVKVKALPTRAKGFINALFVALISGFFLGLIISISMVLYNFII